MNFFMRGAGLPNQAPVASGLDVDDSDPDILGGTYDYSDAEGDLEDEPAPVASDLEVAGTYAVGEELTMSYTFEQLNGAAEGASLRTWQTADDEAFTQNVQQVAAALQYTPLAGDLNKWLRPRVVPVTAGGTQGEAITIAALQVQELEEITFIVLMRRTDSAAYVPDKTYNEIVSNNPLAGTISGNLKTIDNIEHAGLTYELVDTFSNGNNLGPGTAGRYPANAVDNFFTCPAGTRTARFNIPVALQGWPISFTVLGGATSAGPHVLSVTVNAINKQDADVTNNVNDVLSWDYAELPVSGATLVISFIKGTGFCPMNAVELRIKVPA